MRWISELFKSAFDTVVLLLGVITGETFARLSIVPLAVVVFGILGLILIGFVSLHTTKLRKAGSALIRPTLWYVSAVVSFVLQEGYDILRLTWNAGGATILAILLIYSGIVVYSANLLRSRSRPTEGPSDRGRRTWPRLWILTPTAKNLTRYVLTLFSAIIVGDIAFLVLWAHYSLLDALSINGWTVGVAALILYLIDANSLNPVFLEIRFVPVDTTPREFWIYATVSNEGGLMVRSCQVEVRGEGVNPLHLSRVLVEGPRGAVMADPPNHIIDDFPLLSRRAVRVRGKIVAPDNTRVTMVIKVGRARAEFAHATFPLIGQVVDPVRPSGAARVSTVTGRISPGPPTLALTILGPGNVAVL